MAMVRLQTNCHEKDLLDIRKSSENPIHEILIGMNTFAATFARINPTFSSICRSIILLVGRCSRNSKTSR